MNIIKKLGGNKKTYAILQNGGWDKSITILYMMISRGRISRDAALIIYDYCLKNGIDVCPADFQNNTEGK